MRAINAGKILPFHWHTSQRPLRFLFIPILLMLFANSIIPAQAQINAATFAPKVDFTTSLGPVAVAMGDLDGDGAADVAIANYGKFGAIGNTVSILRNIGTDGNVAFAPKVDFTTGNGPHAVALGDLDGDGRLDLVTANTDENSWGTTVSVLRNTSTSGTLSFAPKVDLTTGLGPASVAVGDLDGDGKLDLAASNWNDGSGNTLSVFRNTSTSGVITFTPKQDFATGLGPHGLAIGDLDGDGRREIAVANFGGITVGDGNTVSILRNTSTIGTFSFAPKVDVTTGTGPREISLTDFDGDGKLDLAASIFGVGGSGNTVSVLRNLSTSGTLSFGPKSDLVATLGPLGIFSDDLDGDGKPDLAVTNYGSTWPMPVNPGTTISVFENSSVNGAISFASKVDFGVGMRPHAVAAGDVNQDHKGDLAIVNYDGGNGTLVSVLQNTTGAVFNTPTFTSTPLNTTTPLYTATATNTPNVSPSATGTATGDLLFDDFPGSGLSSSWFARLSTPPSISGGLAVFSTGDSIESNSAFGDATVFEIKAQYSSSASTGLCWTNADVSNYACWVPMSSNTSHFAFLSNTSGQVDSGVIVPSGFHHYAISRSGTAFTVFIDGDAVYSTSVSGINVDRAFLSGYGGFSVDWACVYPAGSSCQGAGTVIPTNTPTALPTATNTLTSTATSTSTSTPTRTPTASNTPTWTPTPSNTPTRTPTASNTPTATRTNTPTLTSTATATRTNTPTNTAVPASVIPQTGWTLQYVDSQETVGENGAAINAFDGNSLTIWHSRWSQTTDPLPHEIQIRLNGTYTLSGFNYLPRQDGGSNGRIGQYEFYVSMDGVSWGTAVASGSFADTATEKTVTFAAKTGQYIRLRALTEAGNRGSWTSAGEINVIGISAGPTFTPTNTPTRTPTVSNTPTNTPTRTLTPSNTPTRTPTPSNTPTRTPTATFTSLPKDTGWLNPSANAAQSGGDGTGYGTSPTLAYANDSSFAVDVNSGTNTNTSCTSSGKDKHNYYNYNVAIPGTVVDGIEVRLDARADSTTGSPRLCIQLSWDGGITWTSAKSTSTLTTSEATYILGSAADNWGRTWTTSNLSNTNFRVRIINVASSTARDFSLDWIAVRVTYH